MRNLIRLLNVLLLLLFSSPLYAACHYDSASGMYQTPWVTPATPDGSNTVSGKIAMSFDASCVPLGSWDHTSLAFGCPEFRGYYQYGGVWYEYDSNFNCNSPTYWPPPPYTPLGPPNNNWRAIGNLGKVSSFQFDTTTIPGCSNLPPPYHFNVCIQNASNQNIGCNSIGGVDSDITLYVANNCTVPNKAPQYSGAYGAGAPSAVPTAAPSSTPTPAGCTFSLTSPAYGSTIPSPASFTVSASNCGNWPGSSGFIRAEQKQPYPYHWDGAPGSSSVAVNLSPGTYVFNATLWLNSVYQIGGYSTNNTQFTVSTSPPTPTATASPSPTPTPTPTPTPSPTASPTPAPTPTPTETPSPTPVPLCTIVPDGLGHLISNCPIVAPGFIIPGGPTPTASPSSVPTPTPTASPTPGPVPTPGAVMRNSEFLDVWGWTTHHGQRKITADQIVQGLQFTGVHHFRDDGTNETVLLTDYCNIHSTTGATMLMLPWGGDITDTLGFLDTLAKCGALMAVEGQNEANNQPFNYNGVHCDPDGKTGAPLSLGCGQFQRDFNAAQKADVNLTGLLMYAPTEMGDQNPDNAGLQFLTIPSGTGAVLPDGTVYADVANVHPYDNCASNPPRDNNAWFMAAPFGGEGGCYDGMEGEFLGVTWRNHFPAYPIITDPNPPHARIGTVLPRVTTESGQSLNQLSGNEDIQGKVYTNLWLAAAKRGWLHWFVYEMQEEGDGMGAVFRGDWSYRLGAVYFHNLSTILADTSSISSPTAIGYSISPLPSTVHSLLMERSDGTYFLVVWDDRYSTASGVHSAVVTLDSTYNVSVFDITQGTSALSTTPNATTVPLTLTDHAVILQLSRLSLLQRFWHWL